MSHDRRPAKTTLRVAPPTNAPQIAAERVTQAPPSEAAEAIAKRPRRRLPVAGLMFFLLPAALGAGTVVALANGAVPSVKVVLPEPGKPAA